MRIQARTEGMVSRFTDEARRLVEELAHGRSPKWFLAIPLSVFLTGGLMMKSAHAAPVFTSGIRRIIFEDFGGTTPPFPSTQSAAIATAIGNLDGETATSDLLANAFFVRANTSQSVIARGLPTEKHTASISYSRCALEFDTSTVPAGSIGVLTGRVDLRTAFNVTAPVPFVIGGNLLSVSTPPPGVVISVPITNINAGGITRIEMSSPLMNSPSLFTSQDNLGSAFHVVLSGFRLEFMPAPVTELVVESSDPGKGSTNGKDGSAKNTATGNKNDTFCQALQRPEAEAKVDPNDTNDPVILHSGEVALRRVDLRIPGRGLDWEFARRYRSRIRYDGPLGHNWEFEDNARLVLGSPDCPILLMDGNGRRDCYTRQPDGSYLSPSGFYTRLAVLQGDPQNPAAGAMVLEIVNRHGLRSRFEGAAGATTLPRTRLSDRNGNAIRFLHEDAAHPTRLTKVLDTYGRPILYLYDAQGHLITVRDFIGREIRFVFDADGNLIEARTPVVTGTPNGNDFPAGKTERYAYSSGHGDERLNHNLLSITAPNEVAAGGPPRVQFVYAESGADLDRCTRQVFGGTNASGIPAGGTIDYQYETLASGPRGSISRTTVTDRNRNVTEYFFDAEGRPLIIREHTRALRAGDPAFYETNHFYNGDGELTKTVFHEGNEIEWVYYTGTDRTQQGNILEEIRRPGPRGGDQAFLKRTYAYEPVFNYLLSMTEERGNDPSFVPQNGGAQSGPRYTLRNGFDYQEGDGTANLAFLSQNTGRSVADLQAVLSAAGMAMNLPDQNGDGVRSAQTNARGSIIRVDQPTANLLANSPQALAEGGTAQEIVTTRTLNRFGQLATETNPEENLTQNLYYPETDPDGDGQDPLATNGAGSASDPDTGGYLRQIVRDAGASTRNLASDIGRNSGQNPAVTQIRTDFFYDRVGNTTGTLDGRGVRASFHVNQLNQTVQVIRAADTSSVPARAGGAGGASEDLSGQTFAYKEQVFFDFNDNTVKRLIENRDGNTPDGGAHPGFIEYTFVFDILDDLLSRTEEVSPTETITWQYRYDPNQNQREIIFPEGNRFEAAFDERDLVLSRTRGAGSPEASTVTYAYDGNRNQTRFTDAEDNNGDGLGESTLTQFDGYDRPFKVTDAAGNVLERRYDPASNVVSEKRFGPVGGATPANNAGATNVLLAQTEHLYDELSREFQVDRVLFVSTGVSTTHAPELQDGPLSPGDSKVTTRFGHDRLSRVRFRLEDDLDLYRTDFDGASRAIRTVDPERNEVLTDWDDNSNPVRTERIEKATLAGVADQRFVDLSRFDSLNRQAVAISNLGHTRRSKFDSRDNRIETSDANGPASGETVMTTASVTLNQPGNTTRTFFDGINREVKTEQDLRAGGQGGNSVAPTPENPDGIITVTQVWDRNSRLKSRTDDRGNTTTNDHDALNRRFRETFADATSQSWGFDRDDNVRTFTDQNGTVRTTTFDGLHRPVLCQVQRAAGVVGTTEQAWEYDGLSRTTKAMDNNEPGGASDDSAVTMAYDSLSRELEEHQILGGNDQVVSSDWQDDDLRKALIYPNGRKVGFAWDGRDRLETVSNLAGEPKQGTLASYEFIGPVRLLERAYQNGTRLSLLNDQGTEASGYDGDQRIVSLRHLGRGREPLLAGFAYAHDREDNRLSEQRTHVREGGDTDLWDYDSAYRVANQKRNQPSHGGIPSEERSWALDGTGNWASLTITPAQGAQATLTQQVNNLNAYTAFGGAVQAEDANGNKLDDGRFLYAWDFLNRPRQVLCKTGGELVSSHLYDAYGANGMLNGSGRRVRKVVTKDDHGCSGTFEEPEEGDEEDSDDDVGSDTPAFAKRKASDIRFLYDGVRIIEERGGASGKVLRQYVYGAWLDEHLTMDVYKKDGRRLKRTLFYHEDAKGWVVALSDKNGHIRERVTYDAYGAPTFTTRSGRLKRNQSESRFGSPFLYGGPYFDSETRLYCMRHRFYSPEQGRFYSRDPIGIWDDPWNSGNGYAYVGGNPLGRLDPGGLLTIFIGGAEVSGAERRELLNKEPDARMSILQRAQKRFSAGHPGEKTEFFAHDEIDKILEYLKGYKCKPSERLNIIGFSWGGDTAIRLANREGMKVDTLVTLDPVSKPLIPVTSGAKPKGTGVWVNIHQRKTIADLPGYIPFVGHIGSAILSGLATPTGNVDMNDWIASTGGQMGAERGAQNIPTKQHHGYPDRMWNENESLLEQVLSGAFKPEEKK